MSAPTLHWREYLIEGGALALFMISACAFGTLLGHPSSPVHGVLGGGWMRRAVMGALMGLTAIAIIYSPWGRRSGAQMNPAVTLTFLRLGRIAPRDALGYIAAQFVGAITGVLVATRLLGMSLAHPQVRYVVTTPGARGVMVAFVAELVIAGLLMSMVLRTANTPRWGRYTGIFAGLLVAMYITIEAPLSGMSMNPARSLGSAVGANHYAAIWIYFTAPLLGMLLAAELFVRRRAGRAIPCGKFAHATPCIFCDYVTTRTR